MNDTTAPARLCRDEAVGWRAELELFYERRGERSVLARRRHEGPLAVQRALYPEGESVCQTIIVHPPGGIVAGDRLDIAIEAGERAHAQLTTPGAARWYRSTGPVARQNVVLRAGEAACIEWLPQETIVFDGALAHCATRVELARAAVFIGWDIFCLARQAAGERFVNGALQLRCEILRDATLLWYEQAALAAGSSCLRVAPGLGGEAVFGTFLAAAGRIPMDLIAACRAVRCASGEVGVTHVPDLLVARYRGPSAEAARHYFAAIWEVVRPSLVARAAIAPRIWST